MTEIPNETLESESKQPEVDPNEVRKIKNWDGKRKTRVPVILETEPKMETEDKDKQSKVVSEKLQNYAHQLEGNTNLFIKLQEELKQKEKQYEILYNQFVLANESKNIAEGRLDSLRTQLRDKEEETKAKDKHIRKLTDKVKQSRKDSKDTNSSTKDMDDNTSPVSPPHWEISPIDSKNREVSQLKEAIWAHQKQNEKLDSEVQRLEKENKANVKVKDETIGTLKKELTSVKSTYQAIREKYLEQQIGLLDPQDKSLGAEMAKIKKEYFFSIVMNCKLNMREECNVNAGTLYETALGENVYWRDWPEWISAQVSPNKKK